MRAVVLLMASALAFPWAAAPAAAAVTFNGAEVLIRDCIDRFGGDSDTAQACEFVGDVPAADANPTLALCTSIMQRAMIAPALIQRICPYYYNNN
jgi:hypothetical protein